MVELYTSTAKVLLADGDTFMRQNIRNALAHNGYRDIHAVGRLSELYGSINAKLYDLIILDADMPDGDAIELIRDMRNGMIGRNPFVPVIVTSWNTDGDLVRRVVDSGADTLIVKPLAPAKLFERIQGVIRSRKPFVATSDYTGPDRRGRTYSNTDGQFHVPNTLKDRVEGREVDIGALKEQIDTLMCDMTETKLLRASHRIAFLVGMIAKAYEEDDINNETKSQIGRVISVAGDMATRVAGTRFANMQDISESLMRAAIKIKKGQRRAGSKQAELLKALANTMLMSMHSGKIANDVCQEIAAAVENVSQRKKYELHPDASQVAVGSVMAAAD